MPVSAQALSAGYETATMPYTGTEIPKMAEGGLPPLIMSNNYATPVRTMSPAVSDYNNMLAQTCAK